MSISYRVARIDSVSYHAHVGERNLFGDLFEVLVDGDVATLEGSLRAPMEDILSYLAPPTITLETKGTYYVAGVEMSVSGELGLLCDSCCVVGHGGDGVLAWTMEGAIDVVEGSGTVIGHIERCTEVPLIFVHVEISGAIVGVRAELEVADFKTSEVVGGQELATDGSRDVVENRNLINITETSESMIAFDIADS